jgi:hypothetical protein
MEQPFGKLALHKLEKTPRQRGVEWAASLGKLIFMKNDEWVYDQEFKIVPTGKVTDRAVNAGSAGSARIIATNLGSMTTVALRANVAITKTARTKADKLRSLGNEFGLPKTGEPQELRVDA